jgi:hypothetical protein
MKHNGLEKLYERLTPEERFRLDVEATARGDMEESMRLTDTCPRRSYTMNEVGFSGRWHGALELMLMTLLDLRARMDKVQMIDAFRVMLPYLDTLWHNDTHEAYFDGHMSGSRHAWSAAGKSGEPPGWEDDEEEAESNSDSTIDKDLEKIDERGADAFDFITYAFDKLKREFTEEAFALWSAFEGFCADEVEIEAMKLLKAIMPQAVEYVQGLEERAAKLEIEADEERVEEYRAIIGEVWPKYIRGATWQGK